MTGVRNTGSEVSIGFSDPKRIDSNASLNCGKKAVQNSQKDNEKDEFLENVCCLVLFCQSHKRLAIKRNSNKGLFLPYMTYRSNDSWKNVSNYLIKSTLERVGSRNFKIANTHAELIDVFRVQLPKTRLFYTRITVLTRIINETIYSSTSNLIMSSEQSNPIDSEAFKSKEEHSNSYSEAHKASLTTDSCCCRISTNNIIWMGIEELNNNFNTKFWGPEPLLFYYIIQENDQEKFELKKNYIDYSIKDSMKFTKKCNQLNQENKLLEEAKYSRRVIIKLFNEYVLHCYPSRYMTYNSFKVFMNKINWHTEDVVFQLIFKALNYRNTNFLSFEELLLGFAAMDINTPHNGAILELRLEYIFRFYDSDSDNKLSLAEFVRMTNDIMYKNQDNEILKTNSAEELAKKLVAYFTNSISHSNKGPKHATLEKVGLTFEQFLSVSLTHKTFCELTSHIFRAPFSILLLISTKFNYDLSAIILEGSLLQSFVLKSKYSKTCQICRKIKFNIASHCIRVSENGEIMDVVNLEVQQLQEKEKTPFVLEVKNTDGIMLANDVINRITRLGLHVFYPNSCERPRFRLIEDKTSIKHWYYVSRSQHLEAIKKVLIRVKEILSSEHKIIMVHSPCYVISGLYGNLKDLLIYSHLLWKSSPFINQATYVFLGNFVDYQPWSVECVIYLFCMKIIAPQRFILLRGIHEVRETQIQINSFYAECNREYKSDILNLINDVFDHLPLGVVIEDQVFCSSSGYPKSRKSLNYINMKLQNALTNPLDIDLVREILSKEVFECANIADTNCDSEEFEKFCKINKINCMIRSHSLPPSTSPSLQQMSGNKFYFNYKVISLFSGSNLLKITENTTSSVALVSRDQIRVIRVETFLKTWASLFEQ